MDGNRPNPDPFIKLPTREQAARQEWLKKRIDDGQKKIDAPMPELDAAQTEWVGKWHDRLSAHWAVLAPESLKSTNGTEFEILDDQSVLAEGANPDEDVHEATLKLQAGSLTAIRLEALPHPSLPKQSSARADDGRFELSEFEAEIVPTNGEGKSGEPKKLKFARAVADVSAGDKQAGKAIDGKADTAWTIPTNAVTEPHTALFVLGEPMKVQENSELRVRLHYQASKSKRAIGHWRLAAAQNEELAQWLVLSKSEQWQMIGPFKSESLKMGLAAEYEPEKAIDFNKSYPGVREEIRWTGRGDLEDAKSHKYVDELHGVHGVFYFYRTLKLDADRKVDLTLRADDLFKVWVNDRLVLEQSTRRKSEEGPAKLTLDLNQGENKILVKAVNHQGACYFTFNADLDDLDKMPVDVAAILATTKEPSGGDKTRVRDFYRRIVSPAFKELLAAVAKL